MARKADPPAYTELFGILLHRSKHGTVPHYQDMKVIALILHGQVAHTAQKYVNTLLGTHHADISNQIFRSTF